MSKQAILKYGIMCSGYEFEQWEANCIENLLSFEQAKLYLLIINDNDPIKPNGIFNKIKLNPRACSTSLNKNILV